VQRLYGVIAVFVGWLSIVIGAVSGLVASEFLGLAHTEGDAPPLAVYGISAAFVLWMFVLAAFTAGVPMAYAMFADDPRLRLRVIGGVQGIAGLILLPDPLGRAFGLPLIVGAVCLVLGGELIHRESLSHGSEGGESRVAALDPGVPVGAELRAPDPAAPLAAPPASPPASPAASPANLPIASSVGPVMNAPAASEPVPARGRRSSRKRPTAAQMPCPWCGESVAQGAESCPSCKATIVDTGLTEMAIPGLTEVQPSLLRYMDGFKAGKKRGLLGDMLSGSSVIPPVSNAPASDASALRPPSAELKAEMARLDAEIAAGTGLVAPESGPESEDGSTQ
jgi:hypothetical protein